MVFLLLIVVLGIPIVIVATKLTLFEFGLAAGAFYRIQNILLRVLCGIAFLAATVGASVPISFILPPLLPDFRVNGDGGVGMAHNALSTAVLFVATPCSIMLLTAFALSQTWGRPSVTAPFDAEVDG